jgi:homoserine O-succinyltransferase
VLVESEQGGVHMAASPDQFRLIYFQGHPEYDTSSLLKEYKREVLRFLNGELHQPPPYPEHYFSRDSAQAANRFVQEAERALREDKPLPDFLEREIEPGLDNTWGDTAKAIIANWLGLVYQLTNLDRREQYMAGVDPANPLNIRP